MVFKTHYPMLCRYAHSYLNDRDEAEEVVQAAFIHLWERRQSIGILTSLKAYLFQTIRNRCLNVIKHEKVKQQHAEQQSRAGAGYESGESPVLSDELEHRIQWAIAQLPDQCRLVFKLSRFEELKYNEIANQLNISVKTVESQMGKALKQMREHLKEFLPLIAVLFNLLRP